MSGRSYGARSILFDARGQRPFLVYAPVQTDKTKESLQEIQKELRDIVDSRPPTADELARAKDKETLTLPGRWETANAVMGSIVEMVRFGYADDYWDSYPDKARALELSDVSEAAGASNASSASASFRASSTSTTIHGPTYTAARSFSVTTSSTMKGSRPSGWTSSRKAS